MSKRSHEAPMTLNLVSCDAVLLPEVQQPITMLRLKATSNRKVSSHLSFVLIDELVHAGTNNCGFDTVDMAEFHTMLWVFYIFQLISFLYQFTRPAISTAARTKTIPICMVIFTIEYSLTGDTRHGLAIYPGYRRCQQFRPIVSTSYGESPAVKICRVPYVLV